MFLSKSLSYENEWGWNELDLKKKKIDAQMNDLKR